MHLIAVISIYVVVIIYFVVDKIRSCLKKPQEMNVQAVANQIVTVTMKISICGFLIYLVTDVMYILELKDSKFRTEFYILQALEGTRLLLFIASIVAWVSVRR